MVPIMADNSSSSRDRKLGLIAPLSIAAGIVVVVLVALAFTNSRNARPAAPGPALASTPAPSPKPPPVPAADPVVGRAELVAAANARAEAYAADGDVAAGGERDPLAGRAFVLRMPFGCDGPQLRSGGAQAFYEFDPQKRTVRLAARPGDWTSLPVVVETTRRGAIEAAEGFWIARPWSAQERCPAPRDKPVPAAPTPPAAETLGLVQLFAGSDSRVGRRAARPYEHVVKLGEGDAPLLAQGYRLVLEGRFGTFPDGRAAHCWSESLSHRPICVFAVAMDRVAFEDGDDGDLIAEWRN